MNNLLDDMETALSNHPNDFDASMIEEMLSVIEYQSSVLELAQSRQFAEMDEKRFDNELRHQKRAIIREVSGALGYTKSDVVSALDIMTDLVYRF